MIYVFYNKNTPVFSFSMVNNHIGSIEKIFNPEYLPMQVAYDKIKNIIDRKSFVAFLEGRRIPDTRQDKKELLGKAKLDSLKDLSFAFYGLSLSDQYWFKEISNPVSWDDINFFTNDFDEDMGKFIFGDNVKDFSLRTPNNTSDGWLKKAWIGVNGKRFLIKGGSAPYFQEPFNEVIAYEIAKELGINHVKYWVEEKNGLYLSVCENFIDKNTELIPINAIIRNGDKPNHVSSYDFVIGKLEAFGIGDAKEKIEEMLFLDYIIFNEDRHYNNFGFIRNVETLKIEGMTPIYDSGTSLFYNTLDLAIFDKDVKVKPFRRKRSRQVELIDKSSFEKIDKEKIGDIILEVLGRSRILEEYSPERKNIIKRRVLKDL